MTTEPIRVPLVEPGTRPRLAEIEHKILAERGRISLLYKVLLNSGPIASGWEHLLTAVRNHSTVPPALRELAILRVAVLNRANFEFDAHVPHARKAGVTPAAIDAIRAPALDDAAAVSALTPLARLVVDLVDTMTRDVDVPDALFERLRPHFDPQGLVELVVTIAAYNMVSRVLVALKIAH